MRVCVHVCMCACVHVCMCACVHVCMYVCIMSTRTTQRTMRQVTVSCVRNGVGQNTGYWAEFAGDCWGRKGGMV